jgi:undecaprenyl diphosphate synthase
MVTEEELKQQISLKPLPKHIAIIMDGNGRWAKDQGQHRIFGHQNGVQSVRNVSEACAEVGVEYLTLYTFSTENWNRPQEEINALMQLLVSTIEAETDTLMKNNIRLATIGDIESLPVSCHNQLLKAMETTAGNNQMQLTLALSYSSRWEILRAVKSLANDLKSGTISPDQINEELFSSRLTTAAIPDPELLIRTSGEHRISNFLLWQLAYTEFYFTDILWPDFRKDEFFKAIISFQSRERRFGQTSEQISTN